MAAEEPYENFIRGTLKKNDSLFVKDEKFRNPEFTWSDITNISVKNAITLSILNEQEIQKSFKLKVILKVEYFSTPTQDVPTIIDSVNLNVNYEKGAGKEYKVSDDYRFTDGYYVKVYVIDAVSKELGSELPDIFQLSSNIVIDRKYKFVPLMPISLTGTFVTGQGKSGGGGMQRLSSGGTINSNTQLQLTWNPLPSGEEYDLEWVTLDKTPDNTTALDALVNNTYSSADTEVAKFFKNNATRVTVTVPSYLISLMYNADIILVRIRQVSYTVDGLRVEGVWSYKQDSPVKYTAWALNWHESKMNWQYSASFAEEGKKKEVVTYFDGSLRGRQTVTLNNAENVAVVQENIYDQFGRAAASILPAPIKEGVTFQNLHYFQKFNQNSLGLQYSFSNIGAAFCETLPQILNVASGASRYYSASSDFKNDATRPFNKYIPDAGGYPLSVTQYTADNTGRIKLQGGVGPAFQPGVADSRVTKYYYGKPEQWELDRVFGNDAGFADHYLKNMVADANKQISVSYLNAAGKTVATALAGGNPANLDALGSMPSALSDTVQLISPAKFVYNSTALTLKASTTHLAAVTGAVKLKYNIEQLISRYPGGAFQPCSNCYYELKIRVVDDCQTEIYTNSSVISIGSKTADPAKTSGYEGFVDLTFAKIGEYHISFELSLNRDVIKYFTDEFVAQGQTAGAVKKESDFILNELNLSLDNFKNCLADCKTAVEKLGTLADFKSMFNTKLRTMGVDSVAYQGYISGLHATLLSTAQALQSSCGSSLSVCDQYMIPMLEDVSPGGQYALFTAAGAPLETELNVLYAKFRNAFPIKPVTDSVYKAHLVTFENGSRNSANDTSFTLADLVKYWRPEWASMFLEYHPEYCKLQFCWANSASNNWDEKLRQTTTAAGVPAVTTGSLTYSDTNSAWLLAADPFFATGGAGNSYASSMSADLLQYSSRILKLNDYVSSATVKGLSQYVDYQLYCADSTATTNQNGSTSYSVRWNSCAKVAACRVIDREWQSYRESYLELKQKYYELARGATTCGSACEVGVALNITSPGSGSPGCSFGLGLGSTGSQIAANKFVKYDYAANSKYTYTLVSGVADVKPPNPDACVYANPTFYTCLTVTLSDGQTRSFFNIWLFTCVQRISTSGCYISADVYVNSHPTSNTYRVNYACNPYTITIISGSQSTTPSFPSCSSYNSSTAYYDCYSVYEENGAVHFYNSVWVQICYDYYGSSTCRMMNTTQVADSTAARSSTSGEILMFDAGNGSNYSIKEQKLSKSNNAPASKENYGNYEFKEYFVIQTVPNTFVTLRDVWVAALEESDTLSNQIAAKGVEQNFTTGCSTLLPLKTSRFSTVNYSGTLTTSAGQTYNNLELDLYNSVKSTCDSNAVVWMDRLSAGLTAIGASQAQKDLLKSKLIQICAAGGDISHPFGASSFAGNTYIMVNGAQCRNFGDVIKAVATISTFTNELNPWLIDAPYPYSPAHVSAERTLTNTTQSICTKLTALRPGGYTDLQFYNYLQTQYGTAMKMTYADFQVLLKGCVNCKFLLDKDITLPLFLEENTTTCITKTDYNNAIAAMNTAFGNSINTSSSNYQSILSNYLNFKWGFSLSYDRYKTFEASSDTQLCNEAPYSEIIIPPYGCQKEAIEFAVGNGKKQYESYIAEERRKFEVAYVATCAAAKANVRLLMPQQLYHYTLYYYDQAGNLVRTVPPEGVNIFSKSETQLVDKARNYTATDCTYSGPGTDANKPVALQSLSNTLAYAGNAAVELWLYQNSNSSRQMIVSTPDTKYMFQTCINGNLLNVDVYTLQAVTSGVSITLSNHVTADISSINPILPWTHVVVQGNNLGSGALQLWINGKQYTPVAGAPSAGCSWTISTSPSLVMPENISTLKHMRLYTGRLMTAQEIKTNAESGCFAPVDLAATWYRFNVPAAGSATTIAANSTLETQYKAIYPAHNLVTTYAYNSTGQVIRQQSPDGGTSRFWYDLLGRLIISQNAKQAPGNKYSYTKYDVIGRITEVGEKTVSNATLTSPAQLETPGYLDNTFYTAFLSSGTDAQLTQTVYDAAPAVTGGVPSGLTQNNLRKRIAASIYRENAAATNINASYYDYDLSGNVKTLYQQVSGLGVKKIGYEYDLASGKVNFVGYQQGQNDAFYYGYKYDAENRLTESWSAVQATVSSYGIGSSLDNTTKKLDASYSYYLHGPLARMELGQAGAKAQGMDYAYTLQGWLKGVNGNALSANAEQGADGANNVGRDAIAYSLGYYPGDYSPIGGGSAYGMSWQTGGTTGAALYNGNISTGTVAIKGIASNNPTGYSYGYDQLNRLTRMRQHDLSNGTTTWSSTSINNKYSENYSYDGNGNILSLQRNGPTANTVMDQLGYSYNRDGSGRLVNNKLSQLTDATPGTPNTGELDGQSNYGYDGIGNLIGDTKEGITAIEWSVYGKIRSITKSSGNISYSYDPSGNRVSKLSGGITTWYVRDAQGNALGVYDNTGSVTNWREQQLYGSSRIGMWRPELNIGSAAGSSIWNTANKRNYELSNHLGNVLAVITETRTLTGGLQEPTIVSAQDYYPFGMVQPGRSVTTSAYRYGFNGKENDNEVKGTANQQDYGMRIYDPRVAKFLSVDPISRNYPELTPYQFASNSPLQAVDLDGLEAAPPEKGKKNLLIVVQGYAGPPFTNETQTKNAGIRNSALGSDNDLGTLGSTLAKKFDDLQVVTFASSKNDITPKDISATIKAFKKANPHGQIIAVGHSLGGENLVTALSDIPSTKINLLITLDPRGSGLTHWQTNTDVGNNVSNAINYYQDALGNISGSKLNFADGVKGRNIHVKGSSHTDIDGDLKQVVEKQVSNFLDSTKTKKP
ncbi:RHS repeat domain-containing protein [Pedobacter sp. PWIIR3]